jgi:hypothetical protein
MSSITSMPATRRRVRVGKRKADSSVVTTDEQEEGGGFDPSRDSRKCSTGTWCRNDVIS